MSGPNRSEAVRPHASGAQNRSPSPVAAKVDLGLPPSADPLTGAQ
jgi:hypothetical protein